MTPMRSTFLSVPALKRYERMSLSVYIQQCNISIVVNKHNKCRAALVPNVFEEPTNGIHSSLDTTFQILSQDVSASY